MYFPEGPLKLEVISSFFELRKEGAKGIMFSKKPQEGNGEGKRYKSVSHYMQ